MVSRKSRAAAEAAIKAAFKEFKDDGKASVKNVVEAKELLYAYGHPALDKATKQSRQVAQGTISFSAWSGQSTRWVACEGRLQGLVVGSASNWASVLARVCSWSSTWMIFPSVNQETGREILNSVNLGGRVRPRPTRLVQLDLATRNVRISAMEGTAAPPGWPDSGWARSSRLTPRMTKPRSL